MDLRIGPDFLEKEGVPMISRFLPEKNKLAQQKNMITISGGLAGLDFLH